MNRRSGAIALAVLAVVLGCVVPASAHRLDEYLQATRLAVDLDRVTVEIDLTPGAQVAPHIVASIDTNRDGGIDAAEGEAYARRVLNAAALMVDDRPAPMTLIDSRFPERREMLLGVGIIHLRAAARISPTGAGLHHLAYRNDHNPQTSVYLVNALVPSDHRIHLGPQRRDFAQRGLALDYRVAPDTGDASIWWLLAGLTMTGGLAAARRIPWP